MGVGGSMGISPSTTRDSPEVRVAKLEAGNWAALAMSWGGRRGGGAEADGVLAGVEVGGGRGGGGFVFDVGDNAAGEDAVFRSGSVRHMKVPDDGRS